MLDKISWTQYLDMDKMIQMIFDYAEFVLITHSQRISVVTKD